MMFIALLHRTERLSFRGGAKPRRGNLQHRSTRKYAPINIEYLRFTMLIGCFRIIPRSRRLPRPFGPRNDVVIWWLVASIQQSSLCRVEICTAVPNRVGPMAYRLLPASQARIARGGFPTALKFEQPYTYCSPIIHFRPLDIFSTLWYSVLSTQRC